MSCTCHPFLAQQCLAEAHPTCVSYASLVMYNHLDSVPIPRPSLKKIWTKAFPNYSMSKDYPVEVMMVDLFYDEHRASHEAKLSMLFEQSVSTNWIVDSSVNLFSLCTKVHIYFFPTASGTCTCGTWYGWYVGTGGTLVRIRSTNYTVGTCTLVRVVRWYVYDRGTVKCQYFFPPVHINLVPAVWLVRWYVGTCTLVRIRLWYDHICQP